jgi:hypothetical protein
MRTGGEWAGSHRGRPGEALATYDLTTAVAGPRPVYRASFPFGFELPGPDVRVVVDPAATRLGGRFAALEVPVPATGLADSSAGVVVVSLDGVREARRVTFSPAASFAGATAELRRIDESKPAPQATVTAGVGASGTASFGGFEDVRFALAVTGRSLQTSSVASVVVRGRPLGVRFGLADPADPSAVAVFHAVPDPGTGTLELGAALAPALQAYLDERPGETAPSALLVVQADEPCRFSLTAFATGGSSASDAFAAPGLVASDLLDVAALAARIRRGADPVSAHVRAALGDAALLPGLNAVIAGPSLYDATRFAGVTLSEAAQAALAAGDDVPRLNRLLLQDAYPEEIAEPSAKRVLRFGGAASSAASVAVARPADAAVAKATVQTQESLRADRPVGAAAAAANGAGRAGVAVKGDGTTAVAVAVPEAVSATGVALDLLAASADAEIAVELHADWNGAPSGQALAQGTATLGAPGELRSAAVPFGRVVLPAGPLWLVLRARRGEAVLLAVPAEGDLRVRRTVDGAAPAETLLHGLAAVWDLFSRSGDAVAQAAATLTVGGVAVAGTRDGDRTTYDLAPALRAAPAGLVELTFAASVAGTITVYPPHVEFAL